MNDNRMTAYLLALGLGLTLGFLIEVFILAIGAM